MAGYHGPDPPGSMREQGRRSSLRPGNTSTSRPGRAYKQRPPARSPGPRSCGSTCRRVLAPHGRADGCYRGEKRTATRRGETAEPTRPQSRDETHAHQRGEGGEGGQHGAWPWRKTGRKRDRLTHHAATPESRDHAAGAGPERRRRPPSRPTRVVSPSSQAEACTTAHVSTGGAGRTGRGGEQPGAGAAQSTAHRTTCATRTRRARARMRGWAGGPRAGGRAPVGAADRAGGTGGGAGARAGEGAGAAARAACREAPRLLVASRSRPSRQLPAPSLLLAREARLVRARHVALSGDTCATVHSRPPPHTRSASSPQPARWLPTGRLPVARTHTAQHPAAPIYGLL